MYHAIICQKLKQVFASLDKGDHEPLLAGLAPDFDHVSSGAHAFGGTRAQRQVCGAGSSGSTSSFRTCGSRSTAANL